MYQEQEEVRLSSFWRSRRSCGWPPSKSARGGRVGLLPEEEDEKEVNKEEEDKKEKVLLETFFGLGRGGRKSRRTKRKREVGERCSWVPTKGGREGVGWERSVGVSVSRRRRCCWPLSWGGKGERGAPRTSREPR